jgi:hypothetical protein
VHENTETGRDRGRFRRRPYDAIDAGPAVARETLTADWHCGIDCRQSCTDKRVDRLECEPPRGCNALPFMCGIRWIALMAEEVRERTA